MRVRFIGLCASVAVLAGCSDSKPLTDAERVQLVRSIMHPDSQCIENSGGMLISCAAGNQGGTLSAYVESADTKAIHVDVKMGASASLGQMTAVWNVTRQAVQKLGLEGDAYQQCTELDTTKRTTSAHTLNDYKLDCTSYVQMMTLNVDMTFTPL